MRLSRHLAIPLAALVLAASPSSALGAANHPFLSAGAPIYEDACGVARHAGGLYVSSYYQNKVLLPSGSISPESTGSGPCKIEEDVAGDLYVDDWHEKVVKYSSSELLSGHGTVIDANNPTGFWVQQVTGDLYVAHHTYIAKYSAAGTLLAMIGSGSLQDAYGVAVSEFPETADNIYVPDAASGTVRVFASGGGLIGELNGANTPQGHFTYLKDGEVAVDNTPGSPSYGHVFVLDAIGHGLSVQPAAAIDEFNAKGAYRGQVTGFTDAEPSGIALDPTSHNLFVTSGNTEGSAVFEYGPTSAARTLKVIEEGAGAGTVTSGPVGIACGEYCSAEFNENQSVTLFANPDAHSTFAGWSVVGGEPCPGTGSCSVLMAKAVEVKATFIEPTQANLSLTVSGGGVVTSNPAGISCPSSCGEHFAQGRVVTLKAAPASHQRLAAWSGCTVQANPTECKVTMSEAKAVSATFDAIAQLNLSVGISGSGQGTVTSFPPGIYCPGVCSAGFDEGSAVYLMAAPSPGSGFGGFTGGGCPGTAPLCAMSMDSAKQVGASFTGTADGPGGTAATPSTSSLRLTSSRTAGATALLTLETSEAGTLLIAGPDVKPTKRALSAGTSQVRIALSHHGRRALFGRRQLRRRITLGFIAASGEGAATTTAILRFRSSALKSRDNRR